MLTLQGLYRIYSFVLAAQKTMFIEYNETLVFLEERNDFVLLQPNSIESSAPKRDLHVMMQYAEDYQFSLEIFDMIAKLLNLK